MLKRSPRVGLLGVAIAAALAGCGQDPQLTTYQQRIYDQGTELDEANLALSQSRAQADELARRVTKLQGERDRVAAQLGAAEVSADALAGHLGINSNGMSLDALLIALGKAVQNPPAAPSAEPAAAEPMSTMTAESAAQLTEQFELLLADHEALRTSWEAERQQAVAATHSMQNAFAEQQLAVQEIYARDNEIAYLHEHLEALYQSNLALQAELETASEPTPPAQPDNSVAIAAAEAEAKRLQEAQDSLYALFEARTAALSDSKAALEAERANNAEMAASLADTLAQRDALQTELEAVNKALAAAEELAAAEAANAAAQTAASTGDSDQALAALKKQLQLVADAAGKSAEAARTKETVLSEKIVALQAEQDNIRQQAEDAGRKLSAELQSLQAALDEKAAAAETASAELASLQQTMTEKADAAAAKEAAMAKSAEELQAALETARQEVQAATSGQRAAQADLEAKVAEALAQSRAAKAAAASAEEALSAARTELQTVAGKLEISEATAAATKREAERAYASVEPITAQRDELIKHLTAAQQRVAELEAAQSKNGG